MLAGRVWKGDVMMLPIYEEQIKRKPETPVRVDARTSKIIDQAVARWGGTVVTQAIGHSKVKRGMDLDLVEEARRAGFEDVEQYVQAHPDKAETFQGEFSLHLFRYKPELNEKGKYVGTPVDDAIDFACYLMQTLQRFGKAAGNPCFTIVDYLKQLERQGVISDTYEYEPNNQEIRTGYDTHLKKNLGHAAFRLFELLGREGEAITWIDDGVSAISEHSKLMLRFSNTSPKVTMKCDANPEAWIDEASRLLQVYYALTDYLIEHRGMKPAFRTISLSENEILYKTFKECAGTTPGDIDKLSLAEWLADEKLRTALESDY